MSTISPSLESYQHKYSRAHLERSEDGVLVIRMHTDGGPMIWDTVVHDELAYLFQDVATDGRNKVVVLTGTGDSFCAGIDFSSFSLNGSGDWDNSVHEGQRLLNNLLSIRVPVISVVNGPATVHSEIGILADIVLAADTTYFQDEAHFPNGIPPGDGVHIAWINAIGPKRAAYLLLTGQPLSVADAKSAGAVDEILPLAELMPRAMELAHGMAEKKNLALRYSREVLNRGIRRAMHEDLGFGLAHEALAALEP